MPRPSRFGLLLTGLIVLISVLPVSIETVGIYEDEGIYDSTAESLALGRGYRIESLPGRPPNAKYPPLYSGWLAFLKWSLPGEGLWKTAVLKLSNLPFLLALVWVFYRTMRQDFRWPDQVCEITALFLGVCGSVVPFSMVMMTEIPFTLVTWLFLRELFGVATPGIKPRWWMVFLLGAAIYYLRSAGIAILASGVVIVFFRNFRKEAVLLGLSWALAALPWILWSRHAIAGFAGQNPELAELLRYYVSYDYHSAAYTDTLRQSGAGDFVKLILMVFVSNLRSLLEGLGEIFFPIGLIYAGSLMDPSPMLRWVLGFAGLTVVIAAIRGYRMWNFPGKVVLAAAAVFHTAMFLVWPWPLAVRFLMPIIPVIICFVAENIRDWSDHWRRLRAVLIVCSLGLQVLTMAVLVPGGTLCARFFAPSDTPYREGLEWMRGHASAKDAVLTGFTAQWIGRELEIPTVRYDTILSPASGLDMNFKLRPPSAFTEEVTAGLKKWDQWVEPRGGKVYIFAEASFHRSAFQTVESQSLRDQIRLVWEKKDQPVRIYEVTGSQPQTVTVREIIQKSAGGGPAAKKALKLKK